MYLLPVVGRMRGLQYCKVGTQLLDLQFLLTRLKPPDLCPELLNFKLLLPDSVLCLLKLGLSLVVTWMFSLKMLANIMHVIWHYEAQS